jgi:3-methyladenine DNA glycosylase AlkD
MLHPAEGGVMAPAAEAREAKRALAALARPAGPFDAARYFRDTNGLGFYNVGTDRVRTMARAIADRHKTDWTVRDALAFANALITDKHLEAKGLGVEVLARFRRQFTPALLPTWKRWLSTNYSANWATTDTICGLLIGPLVASHPELASNLARWASDRNLWVRRASIVGLIPIVRRGSGLDILYRTARALHLDREDLIQKAVGWALREAGKADMDRLERYLREHGPRIPRTSVRYAIERFPARQRRELLVATRARPDEDREWAPRR